VALRSRANICKYLYSMIAQLITQSLLPQRLSMTSLQGRSALMSNPRRIFQMTSSPPTSSTMNDYGMWSLHIPAFQAPPQTESPAPMTVDADGDENDAHGSVASAAAAASLIFDARSLLVKREPPPPAPLLVGDAGLGTEVHGTTMLRRGSSAGSAFGFVDVGDGRHQQPLQPSAVYHPFGPASSPRLWTTESMAAVADEYDVSAGPRMASCSGGSLSGSDGGGRPHTSGISSEDRSSTSPTTRVQPLNTAEAATTSTSSNFLIGMFCSCTHSAFTWLTSTHLKAETVKVSVI